MCKKLNELINNKSFCDFIEHSPSNWKIDPQDANMQMINQSIAFLYEELGIWASCFTNFINCPARQCRAQRHSYFSNLSCTGNLSYYQMYMQLPNCKDLNDSYMLHSGMLALIAAFLRIDLLDIYVAPGKLCIKIEQVLLFLLKPSFLTQLKQGLNDKMIEMNDETQDRFNLMNYSPSLRLKFLHKLCWSSQFGAQISLQTPSRECKVNYDTLRKTVNNLYNNFESFEQEWNLNEYKHLQNNTIKQKEIHSKFQLIIRHIFGIACLYECKDTNKAIKFEHVYDANGQQTKEYKFIDLLPKGEPDVVSV